MTELTASPIYHPSVGESAARIWQRLPSLWKTLLPILGALFIVLLPANLIISARFRQVTTEGISAQHQATLVEISSSFDEFFSAQTQYLLALSTTEEIQACAASGCTSAQTLFVNALTARPYTVDNETVELGFLDLSGKQTSRAIRGLANEIDSSIELPLYQADANALRSIGTGDAYIFAVTRDPRLGDREAYQQPIIRFAVPVETTINGTVTRLGYLTSVLSLDDFFAQSFVYSDSQELLLTDSNDCPIASSDETLRTQLYQTWRVDPQRTCGSNIPLQEWDVTAQQYGDSIYSTKVIHGALTPSGQAWTLTLTQPTRIAYAQVDALQGLLNVTHLIVGLAVVGLVFGAERATQRLQQSDRIRRMAHARETRFNPFNYTEPVEDPTRFIGRKQALAEVMGVGLMGNMNLLITGESGSGKTSLLRQIERRIRSSQIPDPTNYYIPVTLNIHGLPDPDFYAAVMETILSEIPDHQTRANLKFQSDATQYSMSDFREDLNELASLSFEAGRTTQITLMLDDAHGWVASSSERIQGELFEVLDAVGSRVNVILTGAGIDTSNFNAPLHNIHLNWLDKDDIQRIVTEPIAGYYEIDSDAVDRIVQHSAGSPKVAQQLCNLAVGFMLEQDADAIHLAQVVRAINSMSMEKERKSSRFKLRR